MTENSSKSTMKFLIYMSIFIVIVLAFVLLYVMPSIKEYKSAKSEYFYTNEENSQLEIKKNDILEQLKKLKSDNKNVITHFYRDFNSSKFHTLVQKYFENISLEKLQSKSDNSALEIYKFNATVKENNPRMLYNFINDLKSYENIIKINFPIEISTRDRNLNIDFHISVYSMTRK
jgi:hypothetical protein